MFNFDFKPIYQLKQLDLPKMHNDSLKFTNLEVRFYLMNETYYCKLLFAIFIFFKFQNLIHLLSPEKSLDFQFKK